MANSKYASYPSLKEAVVYISGGASGIGESLVREFAAQGAKVGFVDMNAEAGAALAGELGSDVAFAHCDLRDIEALKSAFSELRSAVGPASVLINNAARDDRHNWADVTPDYWDDRLNTNLRHFFFAIQAVAPDMIKAEKGSIINFASESWMKGQGGMPCYTTSKAAVHGMTRSFARDLGAHNIRVNTLVPGWIMTARQKELWVTPEALAEQKERQCLPSLIQPEHIARLALYLAADDSELCTAQNFILEGGAL